MFSITLAWTTHELAIYSNNAFHLLTDLFYPITEDQLKILGLYYTEESIKSIMTRDRVDALYFLLSYNLYFIFILLTISVLSIVYVDYFPYLYKIL